MKTAVKEGEETPQTRRSLRVPMSPVTPETKSCELRTVRQKKVTPLSSREDVLNTQFDRTPQRRSVSGKMTRSPASTVKAHSGSAKQVNIVSEDLKSPNSRSRIARRANVVNDGTESPSSNTLSERKRAVSTSKFSQKVTSDRGSLSKKPLTRSLASKVSQSVTSPKSKSGVNVCKTDKNLKSAISPVAEGTNKAVDKEMAHADGIRRFKIEANFNTPGNRKSGLMVKKSPNKVAVSESLNVNPYSKQVIKNSPSVLIDTNKLPDHCNSEIKLNSKVSASGDKSICMDTDSVVQGAGANGSLNSKFNTVTALENGLSQNPSSGSTVGFGGRKKSDVGMDVEDASVAIHVSDKTYGGGAVDLGQARLDSESDHSDVCTSYLKKESDSDSASSTDDQVNAKPREVKHNSGKSLFADSKNFSRKESGNGSKLAFGQQSESIIQPSSTSSEDSESSVVEVSDSKTETRTRKRNSPGKYVKLEPGTHSQTEMADHLESSASSSSESTAGDYGDTKAVLPSTEGEGSDVDMKVEEQASPARRTGGLRKDEGDLDLEEANLDLESDVSDAHFVSGHVKEETVITVSKSSFCSPKGKRESNGCRTISAGKQALTESRDLKRVACGLKGEPINTAQCNVNVFKKDIKQEEEEEEETSSEDEKKVLLPVYKKETEETVVSSEVEGGENGNSNSLSHSVKREVADDTATSDSEESDIDTTFKENIAQLNVSRKQLNKTNVSESEESDTSDSDLELKNQPVSDVLKTYAVKQKITSSESEESDTKDIEFPVTPQKKPSNVELKNSSSRNTSMEKGKGKEVASLVPNLKKHSPVKMRVKNEKTSDESEEGNPEDMNLEINFASKPTKDKHIPNPIAPEQSKKAGSGKVVAVESVPSESKVKYIDHGTYKSSNAPNLRVTHIEPVEESEDADSDAESRKAIMKSAKMRIIQNISTSESESRVVKTSHKASAKKKKVESDSDDAPEAVSFADGRHSALTSLKKAVGSIQLDKQRKKELRRQRLEKLKLQKEEKLIRLKEKKASLEDASCSSSEESGYEDETSTAAAPGKVLKKKKKKEKENENFVKPQPKKTYFEDHDKRKKRKAKHDVQEAGPVDGTRSGLKRLPSDVIQSLPDQLPAKKTKPGVGPANQRKGRKTQQGHKPAFQIQREVDYIPLSKHGATQFGVVPLQLAMKTPLSKAEQAEQFRQEALYGGRIKRMQASQLHFSLAHKQKFSTGR